MRTCELGGCGRKHYGDGLCNMHYMRRRRHGTTDDPFRPDTAARLWRTVDTSGGPEACWPWTGGRRSHFGYGRLRVNGVETPAHRLAYELTNGPLAPDVFACHTCDNPPCCNPAHIFPGSPADNMADMKAKGRALGNNPGSRHGMSKLTEADVLAIRAAYAVGGGSQAALAGRFGVSQTNVGLIVRRKAWAHV